jgi:hypothetical protein
VKKRQSRLVKSSSMRSAIVISEKSIFRVFWRALIWLGKGFQERLLRYGRISMRRSILSTPILLQTAHGLVLSTCPQALEKLALWPQSHANALTSKWCLSSALRLRWSNSSHRSSRAASGTRLVQPQNGSLTKFGLFTKQHPEAH